MMMTIAGRLARSGQLAHQTIFNQTDGVRVPVARRSLLMLNRVRPLAANVLNQRPAARDIQYLHAEAYGEEWHRALLNFCEYEQIRFVLERMDMAQLRVRVVSVSQRVDV